jgi:DNA-binding MarR family transcriptional regulator
VPVPPRSAAGDALTELVLPAFELNGEFLAAAEQMTRPVGLTPAWWQVLGATLDEPLPVAEIARRVGLGLARQSVQRVADLLVDRGWAAYRDNPSHRRAKLLEPTDDGRATVTRLAEAQHAWADAVGAEVGEDELRRTLDGVRRIIEASRAYRAQNEVERPGR